MTLKQIHITALIAAMVPVTFLSIWFWVLFIQWAAPSAPESVPCHCAKCEAAK